MTKKDQQKFERMKKAGEISSVAMKKVLKSIKPGVKLSTLDTIAEKTIISLGAIPAFKRVSRYDYTTCINVNEGIVHGIPGDYVIKSGDIISVDLGAFHKGYNSDQCWTVEVDTNNHAKFLETGKVALKKAISQAIAGNRVGDISSVIQHTIEKNGFTVSRDLTGHGVGKNLHQFPYIPCFGTQNSGNKLKEGMTLAIEVIYQVGDYPISESEDGWTLMTSDKSLSAVFEHTIGITSSKPFVFTDF